MQWVKYSDEFVDIYNNHAPVTSLGQIKRLYITYDHSKLDISETNIKKLLFKIICTRTIPKKNE